MNLWRISKFQSLSGEGGRLYAGRWNSVGHPVVYLAESAPGALIEVLVHLEIKLDKPAPPFTLLRVEVPPRLRVTSLDVPVGDAWRTNETITRMLGDTWLESKSAALAKVPSAILPQTFNYLLNPLHPDASKVRVAEALTTFFDQRLIKR